MNYQEYMIQTTQKAADEAFRYAKAVPADKLEWTPSETSRSVLDQCRELAMCPGWAKDIITDQPMPDWNEETLSKIRAEQEQWKTVEECQAECNRRLQALFEVFRGISEERLTQTKWLPYDGGRDFTVAEMMDYPRWNFNYHLGQISFIQTMYGDKEMH